MLQINKDTIGKVRETWAAGDKAIKDKHWSSCYKQYSKMCDVTTIDLPVQNGEATIKIFMIKPQEQAK